MRIIIDAMGGDNAPGEVIKGAVSAARDFDTEIILVGDKEKIGNIRRQQNFRGSCPGNYRL